MDREVLAFVSSKDADTWIFEADLLVDRAHTIMLESIGILTSEEKDSILAGLSEVKKMGVEGIGLEKFDDIHMAIETALIDRIGEVGGKMHTGRSRNDEVSTCIRIALRGEVVEILMCLKGLLEVLFELSENHLHTPFPGYTHLQQAQPITLAHYFLSFAAPLGRDIERFIGAYGRINMSPLGAGALAGSRLPLDREFTAELLGFHGVLRNTIDAVSSRDFAVEAVSSMANLMATLSRLAEDLILWSSGEFSALELKDRYASTSSIMPHKKNPDVLELVRAKTGTLYGCLASILTITRALPMSYNRDLQEITPHILRAVEITKASVSILSGVLETSHFKSPPFDRYATTTDLADELVVSTKLPFRDVHNAIGDAVKSGRGLTLDNLDEVFYRRLGVRISDHLSNERLEDVLDPEKSPFEKIGGPNPEYLNTIIEEGKVGLEELGRWLESTSRAISENEKRLYL